LQEGEETTGRVGEMAAEGPKLFVAAKAFVSYNGKVLILQESSNYKEGINAGKFDVPGGRMSPGETIFDCLKREAMEETGISITTGRPFFITDSKQTVNGEQWQVIRIYFSASAGTDAVTLSEDHKVSLWIDPKDYRKHGIIENVHPVFDAYLELNDR